MSWESLGPIIPLHHCITTSQGCFIGCGGLNGTSTDTSRCFPYSHMEIPADTPDIIGSSLILWCNTVAHSSYSSLFIVYSFIFGISIVLATLVVRSSFSEYKNTMNVTCLISAAKLVKK